MTQDEIIRMALDAGYPYGERGDGTFKLLSSEEDIVEILKRFAALVAAHEREKQAEQEPVGYFYDQSAIEMNGWKAQKDRFSPVDPTIIPLKGACNVRPLYAAPVSIEAAALAEREACAKVCEEFGEWRDTSGVDCAAAIRARG